MNCGHLFGHKWCREACMKASFGANLCLTNFWFIDHTETRPFLFNWGLSAQYTNGTVRKFGLVFTEVLM